MSASAIVTIAERVQELGSRLSTGGGAPRLIAVSKTRSLHEIKVAATVGIRDFGENYVQEALPKILASKDMGLVWHFIGRIQRNKVRDIAQHFQWVHTLARDKIAHGLNRFRTGDPLNVCIQLDLESCARRYGVPPHELEAFVQLVENLPGLRLRGLMFMPAPGKNDSELRVAFSEAKTIFDATKRQVAAPEFLDTLSMGMSGDFAMALEAGSTCVRVGTAMFGQRS